MAEPLPSRGPDPGTDLLCDLGEGTTALSGSVSPLGKGVRHLLRGANGSKGMGRILHTVGSGASLGGSIKVYKAEADAAAALWLVLLPGGEQTPSNPYQIAVPPTPLCEPLHCPRETGEEGPRGPCGAEDQAEPIGPRGAAREGALCKQRSLPSSHCHRQNPLPVEPGVRDS